jgi:NAD(P) transhydrogenase
MEQGRLAVCYAFHGPVKGTRHDRFCFIVPLIPEIGFIGKTEEQLTYEDVPYGVGVARYSETTRGQIMGDSNGMLKIIFHRETLELLAVHVIGEGATELIHLGQMVLLYGGKIDDFVNIVFNYPTLAQCYKMAAFDGISRLRGR